MLRLACSIRTGGTVRVLALTAVVCLIGSGVAARTPLDPPNPLPPPSAQSRLASPVTTAPVQPDSLFAPVVAASPAERIVTLGGVSPYTGGASAAAQVSLDGPWRFQLESSACDGGPQCEGISGRWFDPGFDDSGWRELDVPGHFTRQIPLDELGGRESRLPFNFAWYRRSFTIPDSIDPATQHLRLVFHAVDYRADVWLDGTQLDTEGAHVGTFNPFAFDLPALGSRGPHSLVVRVQKPFDTGILACGDGSGGLTDMKLNLDGTKGYHDSRPGGNDDNFDAVAKQSLHTGGIVQPVELVATGPLRIDWVFLTALPSGQDRASVLLSYTLTNLTAAEQLATLTTTFGGPGLGAPATPDAGGSQGLTAWVSLHPGANRVELRADLAGVSFWFPAGHPELGGPALYAAQSAIVEGWRRGGAFTLSDERVDTFGIRSLGLVSDRCEDRFAGTSPDPSCADQFAYTQPPPELGETPAEPLYQRYINGKRIFVAGAGGIPNSWVAYIDRPAADDFMSLLRSINGNHLNVHGQLAPPLFYDAADAAGITVVQDFELQWTYNDNGLILACNDKGFPNPAGNDPELGEQLIETAAMLAADEVYLFYNHPSIIHWVMHNEPPWELAQEIGGDSQAGRALDRRVVDVATGIDQTRPVKAGSGVGDSHEYRGYASCSYFDVLGLDPSRKFCHDFYHEPPTYLTEFGTNVWPFSAKRWMSPDTLFPADPTVRREIWTDTNPKNSGELVPWLREWVYHASHPSQFSTYVGSPADYTSFQDFALASQLYQGAFFKFYIEHFRKDRFRPTAGLRLFYLREYWDAAFFGLFDEYDVASAAVGVVRNAYAPVLVTTETGKAFFTPGETVHLPIWIVNDLHAPVPDATLRWQIERIEHSYVLRGAEDFSTPPYQDLRRTDLGIPDVLPPHPTVTTIEDPDAAPVGAPLQSGSLAVSVGGDSVSPEGGAVALDFVAPGGPERMRAYVLDMSLESAGSVVAHNRHLIAVADASFSPPFGLSDGTTAFGENTGDLALRFRLTITGLAGGAEVTIATPGFGGASSTIASAAADASGEVVFASLAPDEYVVESGGNQVAHLGLTEDTTLDLKN
ncbi:MAG TPA: glycoside hydrolase family 2 TIM barrel-domain containing protein [Candidatus Bathyarchaeia archaeon]|nr:glycoside hydrolase family 2 TIM barrel-domain containing protein [Candidatus Bathyarchaeia archaeon]